MTANGLGPWWFPDGVRRLLTWLSSFFFDEASWRKHDRGYAIGYPARAKCDWKFLQAMIRDASRTEWLHRMLACILLGLFFYALVRAFGFFSYNGTFQLRFKQALKRWRNK